METYQHIFHASYNFRNIFLKCQTKKKNSKTVTNSFIVHQIEINFMRYEWNYVFFIADNAKIYHISVYSRHRLRFLCWLNIYIHFQLIIKESNLKFICIGDWHISIENIIKNLPLKLWWISHMIKFIIINWC